MIDWRADAQRHAESAAPREACGLVVMVRGKLRYWPCRNMAEDEDHFVLHPDDQIDAEDAGTVVAVVHSHPDEPATPSEADRAGCEASGLPWHVYSVRCGQWETIDPSQCLLSPLLGREFVHGLVDCYSLCRDWYRMHLGVLLPDFPRAWGWWERGESLYEDNFATAGFVECQDLREGDALLMRIGRSQVPNHAAIWMADDTVIHHMPGRLSSRDPWDGYLRRATVRMLRHVG